MNKIIILILLFIIQINVFGQKAELFIHESDTCFILADSLNMNSFHAHNQLKHQFPNGIWARFVDSTLVSKFTVRNNLLHGLYTLYLPSKSIVKGNYVDGYKEGPSYWYNKSGQISSKSYWESGSQKESYSYYENGSLEKRFLNVSDSLDLHTYYYPNGFKKSEGLFSIKMDYKTLKYENWKAGKWTNWFDNGIRESFGNFSNGKKNSAWEYFNKENNFVKSEYYDNGTLIKSSTTVVYGETGIVKGKYKKQLNPYTER